MSCDHPEEMFSVLEALKPALNSIDVRCIAASPLLEEPWENLITSIRISEKKMADIKELQEKIPILRNNHFALFLAAYPFNYTIFSKVMDGQVDFLTIYGRNKVRYRKTDLLKLKMQSTQIRTNGSLSWILTADDSGIEQDREKLWKIVSQQEREAKLQGYPNVIELISDRLGFEYKYKEKKDIGIIIPQLAWIEKASFNKSTFDIKIKKVNGLNDLQLNLNLERMVKGNFYDSIWRKIWKIKHQETSSIDDRFDKISECFDLPQTRPFDVMNLELIHGQSAFTVARTTESAPLDNIVEPFFKAVDSFCPIEKFKQMIFEPETYGKVPNKIFENAIAWLLSLSGYNVVYLGNEIKGAKKSEHFDVLRNKTGYEIGCADIIAYEENKRLLLIDCDIGSLDDKKVNKLIETGKYFLNTFEFGKLEIVPVLITPKDCKHEVKEGLRIVDRYALNMVFERLVKGDREGARDAFCYFGW